MARSVRTATAGSEFKDTAMFYDPEGEPFVLVGDEARRALIRGMGSLTALLRPTLGPVGRTVAITRVLANGPPEVLDSAATIARRTIQLPDPRENMGAMLVRGLAEQMHERVGDGAATAAVLAQALAAEGDRYLAAGGNPVALRRGIERGLAAALAELRRQARPVEGPAELAGVAAGIVRDPRLAEIVGEVADSVGAEGAALVEAGQSTETTYEYLDGIRWDEGYLSPHFVPEGESVARLLDVRILATDLAVERAEQLAPALEACVESGERRLVVIAPEVRDAALALLLLNRDRGIVDGVLAVRAPAVGHQRARIVEDIAALTGGRPVRAEAGERLEAVTAAHLGRARQVWATRAAFGILGGQGERAAIRESLAVARAELAAARDDRSLTPRIRARIGRLSGAAAVIRVGGASRSEQDELKLRVEAALGVARLALESGVVPGGGAALLACRPALAALERESAESVGARALARALGAPARVILRNAGLDPEPILAELGRGAPGQVFDVIRRDWTDAWGSRIVDPLPVVSTALEVGASAAATALATEALVRRGRPRWRRPGR